MLSSEQKTQQKSSKSTSTVLAEKSSTYVREASSNYDVDRVTELWANLTMIQQMKGDDHWLKNSQNSGLTWNEYIAKLVDSKGAKVLTFENQDLIFGFAYMTLENINASKPNLRPSLKAVIKEVYLEPAYRKKINYDVLAELMRKALQSLDINYFEIDVKDLVL
jgi:hypothetical protein